MSSDHTQECEDHGFVYHASTGGDAPCVCGADRAGRPTFAVDVMRIDRTPEQVVAEAVYASADVYVLGAEIVAMLADAGYTLVKDATVEFEYRLCDSAGPLLLPPTKHKPLISRDSYRTIEQRIVTTARGPWVRITEGDNDE